MFHEPWRSVPGAASVELPSTIPEKFISIEDRLQMIFTTSESCTYNHVFRAGGDSYVGIQTESYMRGSSEDYYVILSIELWDSVLYFLIISSEKDQESTE